mmetsp:Transcript_133085/g.284471  ORF Transcript_133085/g.284471 Transcript_133085/m.284471 type:complete len:100 (-) Transcript_133085:92-391(-)
MSGFHFIDDEVDEAEKARELLEGGREGFTSRKAPKAYDTGMSKKQFEKEAYIGNRAGPQALTDPSKQAALPFRIFESKMIPQAIGQNSVFSVAKPFSGK